MQQKSVLARGVRIVADIHHSHGMKAAVAVGHLRQRFPHWTDDFVQRALQRSQWFDELVIESAVAAPLLEATYQRAQTLLARAVIPACYGALRNWADSAGADVIIGHYLEAASADPGYLGHRLSVLLAFHEAWPLYRDSLDRILFLDRLTEFILACHFTAEAGPSPVQPTTWNNALSAALAHPGFFGHHAICLAWAARNRDLLTVSQFANAMAWVVRASHTTYPAEEDNVSIAHVDLASVDDALLEPALRELLINGTPNIHLLTLADAIAYLWNDAGHDGRACLLALAQRFTESCPR